MVKTPKEYFLESIHKRRENRNSSSSSHYERFSCLDKIESADGESDVNAKTWSSPNSNVPKKYTAASHRSGTKYNVT